MTKIDIAALRELHGKATPGEWFNDECVVWFADMQQVCCGRGQHQCCGEPETFQEQVQIGVVDLPDTATFIAAAHNALPALLDRIEELEGALTRLGGMEAFTVPFMRAENSEGKELAARMDFARAALTQKEPT